ncbi:MAG TPA: PilZ domain-containing protein [Planctomycetota bacterium]
MSSTPSEHDRRGAARQTVTYRLDVLAPSGSAGCVIDVSQTGLRVRFREELDLAGTQRLKIVFPRWLELGPGLDLPGRFVWMRASPVGTTEAGFAFDALPRKERGLIQVLIQRLAEALAEDRPSEPVAG